MQSTEPEAGARRRAIAIVAGALAAAAIVLLAWRALHRAQEPQDAQGGPSGDDTNGSPGSSAAAPRADPRCVDVSPEPFVIGDAPAPRALPAPDAEAPDDEVDQLSPFAVEVSRGANFAGGYAVGALRDAEGGSVAYVATLGGDGRGGKLVRLGRTRGDLSPPIVAGAGPAVLAVMMEPNASGRSIRVAKISGEEVTWGAEVSEGRDESLAVDLAVSGERAALVWDDVTRDDKVSSVQLMTFDVATLKSITKSRPVSPPKIDAEEPRLIARPGGYWLAYAVRAEVHAPKPKTSPKGATADKTDRKDDADRPDEDTSAAGEAIGKRWVEIVPLDETGTPAGAARAVTAKTGNVLAFDLELGEGGAALVAFRDDDTPSGSSGGRLGTVLVRVGGAAEPRIIAEENLGSGAPDLLPGWIAVADVSGATRLGGLDESGQLVGTLEPEPMLRGGEPLAGAADRLLVARAAGKAMRLSVVRCTTAIPDAGP